MEAHDKFGFCNLKEEEFNTIRQVLNGLFDISHWEDILTACQTLSADLADKKKVKYVYVDRNKIVPRSDDSEFLNQFLNKSFTAGIDFPTLLKPAGPVKGTVILIAEDPLRDFNHEQVILSTPFGTHVKNDLDQKQQISRDVIEFLLYNGYAVYQTSVFKLWLKPELGDKVRIKGNFLKLSEQALLDEFAFFKPALIVNFGSLARYLNGYLTRNLNLKDIYFPNPSPTANAKWGLVLGKKNLIPENKSNYIIKKIKSKLRLPDAALLWNKSAPAINN